MSSTDGSVVSAVAGNVTARALVGSRSLALAWNHTGSDAERDQLWGFAVERTDLTTGRTKWLEGQRWFPGQEGLGPNVPSDVAPFQRFRWGDYGVYPGHRYRYEVHPVSGDAWSPVVEPGPVLELVAADHLAGVTGVYSNRGAGSSLAYRTRFGQPPDKLPKRLAAQAYNWLARDLKPACLRFINATDPGDELRLCVFEFDDLDVLAALISAVGRGVRVRLIRHAKPDTPVAEDNEPALQPLVDAGGEVIPREQVPALSHNKFMVHLQPDGAGGPLRAIRVWTGSTNLTRNGFYLQTNLGLVFHDPDLCASFAELWEVLALDPTSRVARTQVAALVNRTRARLADGPEVYFSPVSGTELLDRAVELVRGAKDLVLISSPFGLDGRIRDAINTNDQAIVEYGLVNTTAGKLITQLPVSASPASWFVKPAWMPRFDGQAWDNQPFGQHKIHTKAIVADPFSDAPRVLVGSANFSDESVNANDENAFLIDGDPRVAAIIATEFLRMFDHYKTRMFLEKVDEDPGARHLKPRNVWWRPYYDPADPKSRERVAFAGL